MLLFHRTLLQELVNTAIATFSTLLVIVTVILFIRYAGQSSHGEIPPEAILIVLGFSILTYLPVLLMLVTFISVLLTLARQYRQSETTAWFSAGLSLKAWLKPAGWFTFVITVFVTIFSLQISPWAIVQNELYRLRAQQDMETAQLNPGIFKEYPNRQRVFFVNEDALNNEHSIYIFSTQDNTLSVMSGAGGEFRTKPDGSRFLVIRDGYHYEGRWNQLDYLITQFDLYGIRVSLPIDRNGLISYTPRGDSFDDLLISSASSPPHKAEILWRISIPIATILLSILAIPLGFVNPRYKRSFQLLMAILIFMLYSNLINLAQNWVSSGRGSLIGTSIALHLSVALTIWILFQYRSHGPSGVKRMMAWVQKIKRKH